MLSKVSGKELVEFTKLFSLMLMSRLSIVQSLELLVQQTKNERLKKCIKQILTDVNSGQLLSKSFAKHTDIFSDIYITNLKVAEETGEIAKVLSEYSVYLENMLTLKRKLIQSARYPIMVLSVSVLVLAFMVFFLIPGFNNLFFSSKIELPPVTQFIFDISNFVKDNLNILILVSAVCIFTLLKLKTMESTKVFTGKLLIRLPVVSKLYITNLLARFSLSMSMLLNNGITLLDALKISKNVTGNRQFKHEIDRIIKEILKGETLSAKVVNSSFFDLTFTRLLSVGEESAEFEKVFKLISNYYSSEFDYSVDNLTSLIEPFLILTVGIIIAIILIAMYLPIFELVNNFGI